MNEVASIQSLFSIITNHIFEIIYAFAIIEVILVGVVVFRAKRQTTRLLDSVENLTRGFHDAPEKDSSMTNHERIQSMIQYVQNKMLTDEDSRGVILNSVSKQNEKSAANRYQDLEVFSSIMSTLVQVFPLLGILGTILAIAGTAGEAGGKIDPEVLTSAFVVAMDTTILGIGFSILFMLVESALIPKVERVVSESVNYRKVLDSIYQSKA